MRADSKIIKIKKLLAEDYGENHGLLVDDIKRVRRWSRYIDDNS